MTKIKTASFGICLVVGIAATWLIQQRTGNILRQENEALRQQTAQLIDDNARLTRDLSATGDQPRLSSNQLSELLKLRSEVGVLRQRQRALDRTAGPSNATSATNPAASATAEVPAIPQPFQVQLVLDEPGDDSETLTNFNSNGVGEVLHVKKTALMDQQAIHSANVTTSSDTGTPQIEIEMTPAGREQFAQITQDNLNHRLAIMLNGQVYSAPVIRTPITGGKAVISGSFTEEEAKALAARINESLKSP
jgi:hypothetical protein